MLEVRDLPMEPAPPMQHGRDFRQTACTADGMTFQAMETPLVMSGFRPEAMRLWQEKMAGTGLEMVAAGGGSGSSLPGRRRTGWQDFSDRRWRASCRDPR